MVTSSKSLTLSPVLRPPTSLLLVPGAERTLTPFEELAMVPYSEIPSAAAGKETKQDENIKTRHKNRQYIFLDNFIFRSLVKIIKIIVIISFFAKNVNITQYDKNRTRSWNFQSKSQVFSIKNILFFPREKIF
jgi:hypothetical protein